MDMKLKSIKLNFVFDSQGQMNQPVQDYCKVLTHVQEDKYILSESIIHFCPEQLLSTTGNTNIDIESTQFKTNLMKDLKLQG